LFFHRLFSLDLNYAIVICVINVKKILAVINATYAVAKRKPEKIRLAGIRTLTSAIPVLRCIYFFIPQFKYMNFRYS